MRYLYIIITILTIVLVSSCRKDFETIPSSGKLEFSKDTVFFNRVFDNISSSTHKFVVRNNSDDDINIPSIALSRGSNSFYRLNVDGKEGKSFQDITVLAKDSVFVFAEVTIDFSQVASPDFMYRDQLLFDSGINEQKVELEALVLDVNLIRPNRTAIIDGFDYEEIVLGQDAEGNDVTIRGTTLIEDTVWGATDDKPYLIYNYVGVPAGKTLTIDAGTQLHFHSNSGIIVQNGGSLIVNGTQSITDEFENQVVFQGDRLEADYEHVPGQWGTIWLMEGSENSIINHATIKNATIGLLVDSNSDTIEETLQANNMQVYNTTSYGILGRNAKITAKNTVISNNGEASFASVLGGTYHFYHATIANYWRNSSRQESALSLSNSVETQTAILVTDLEANFTNCIIYGSQNIEFALHKEEAGTIFDYNFKNCLLKFNDVSNDFTDDVLYDFSDTNLYQDILINKNPNFFNTNTAEGEKTDLIIGDDSFANNQADASVLSNVVLQKDILGVDRVAPFDIGAYQHVTFPVN